MSPDREAYWRRKLGRLRLGAEPIEDQLARHRRALMALSGATVAVGSIILALFTGFGRPGIGAVVSGLIVVPVVGSAWIGYARLRRTVLLYRRDMTADSGSS